MTRSCWQLQAKPKRTRCVWYGSPYTARNASTYGVISRFTYRPSPRFRTGQRPARRLGTFLALIFRQVASTLLLVTLAGVFYCTTSKIMMHTEGHGDQELYITSISYMCLRGTRSSRDKPRITVPASKRRQTNCPRAPRDMSRRTRKGSRTETIHEVGVCLSDLVFQMNEGE